MSKDLNKCFFIGRLGKAPEIKYLPNGDAVANFSIACSDDYKKKDGQLVEKTNWITVVAYRRLAEIIGLYLDKGSKIHIEGKQQTRKWQDQNGQDRYTTEIIASEMQMLDSRGGGSTEFKPAARSNDNFASAPAPASAPPAVDDFDDDIPF